MKIVQDPRTLQPNQKVSFDYNSKRRVGTVERVMNGAVTIKHEDPKDYKDKVYSTYMFHRINGRIEQS